jgi:hypothetical protein
LPPKSDSFVRIAWIAFRLTIEELEPLPGAERQTCQYITATGVIPRRLPAIGSC